MFTFIMEQKVKFVLNCSLLEMSPGSSGSGIGAGGTGTTGGGGGPHSRRDRINERGETALHLSSKKGDQETVKKLLEQGSNPNVTDFAGEWSLDIHWLTIETSVYY